MDLYGPFALTARYGLNTNIDAACPFCHVRITSCGKKLPKALETADVYGDVHERSLIFLLDESYHGEVVEISLQDIMHKMSKPMNAVHIDYIRKNDLSLSQKGASVVQFRNPEHSITTMCIRSNETVRIFCQLPALTRDLVVVVRFIISGYQAQTTVVG
jgi:hypothetical protein